MEILFENDDIAIIKDDTDFSLIKKAWLGEGVIGVYVSKTPDAPPMPVTNYGGFDGEAHVADRVRELLMPKYSIAIDDDTLWVNGELKDNILDQPKTKAELKKMFDSILEGLK